MQEIPSLGSQQCSPPECRNPWPQPAVYLFAGRREPIIVLGLAPMGDVRVIRADGTFDHLPEFRVRLLPSALDRLREVAA